MASALSSDWLFDGDTAGIGKHFQRSKGILAILQFELEAAAPSAT
jgi:hypothetical protein